MHKYNLRSSSSQDENIIPNSPLTTLDDIGGCNVRAQGVVTPLHMNMDSEHEPAVDTVTPLPVVVRRRTKKIAKRLTQKQRKERENYVEMLCKRD